MPIPEDVELFEYGGSPQYEEQAITMARVRELLAKPHVLVLVRLSGTDLSGVVKRLANGHLRLCVPGSMAEPLPPGGISHNRYRSVNSALEEVRMHLLKKAERSDPGWDPSRWD